LQARAYMLAHGANPDAMSEQDYELVMVSLNDGLIGNKNISNILAYLTTGIFNYIRGKSAKSYEVKDILGLLNDYIYKPLSEQEKKDIANQQLLSFMQMMPESSGKFKNVKN
jgi:hypothetical protein